MPCPRYNSAIRVRPSTVVNVGWARQSLVSSTRSLGDRSIFNTGLEVRLCSVCERSLRIGRNDIQGDCGGTKTRLVSFPWISGIAQ